MMLPNTGVGVRRALKVLTALAGHTRKEPLTIVITIKPNSRAHRDTFFITVLLVVDDDLR